MVWKQAQTQRAGRARQGQPQRARPFQYSIVQYSTVQYSSRVGVEAGPEADCGQGEAGAAAEGEGEPGGAAEGATLAAVVQQRAHQQTHPAPARS